MKLSLRWLKDHLETSFSATQLAESLTSLGIEVEDIHIPGENLSDFIIGEVLAVDPHPQADRLQVLKVATGGEILSIVCGDLKVRQGMKGVLGRPGTFVPGLKVTLKQTQIRGIESQGMLCSFKELGLAEASEGVIQLPPEAPVGIPYVKYAQLDDPLLDLSITPNRGDCLSVYGIARELAAAGKGTLRPLSFPSVSGHFEDPYAPHRQETPELSKACPLFAGRLIRGVHNGPSPSWLKNRLESVGARSISTLVDITNLLCFELGRPLHVFDADTFQGRLAIRFARPGESFKALDEKIYPLDPSMLVVADDRSVLSLAGVMGGMDSACTEKTVNVYVESALFNPSCIAQTGRTLSLFSESRHRFERGVDPALVLPTLEKATQLIMDLCGGEPSTLSVVGEIPPPPPSLLFSPQKVGKISGLFLPESTIQSLLQKVGFEHAPEGSCLRVQVPSWRHDITYEEDLVEEVLRLNGLEEVPLCPFSRDPLPSASFDLLARENKRSERREWLTRKVLAERGYTEALTWSFVSEEKALLFGGGDEALRLDNPISSELTHMRPSLVPNLLEALARNKSRGVHSLALFESGFQYEDATPSGQRQRITGVRLSGEEERRWVSPPPKPTVWDTKADAWAILEACGVSLKAVQISEEVPSFYHPGRSGTLRMGPKTVVGTFGVLHPRLQKIYDFDHDVFIVDIHLSELPFPKDKEQRAPFIPSPYQAVERDFAFVVDISVPAEALLKAIHKAERILMSHVTLFDVYQGPHVPAGKKSLGFSVRLLAPDRTLTEEEIQTLSEKIIQTVQQDTGALLRQ